MGKIRGALRLIKPLSNNSNLSTLFIDTLNS